MNYSAAISSFIVSTTKIENGLILLSISTGGLVRRRKEIMRFKMLTCWERQRQIYPQDIIIKKSSILLQRRTINSSIKKEPKNKFELLPA